MTKASLLAHSKSPCFYWASRLLNKQQRQTVERLYALCRTIDNIADDPLTSSEKASATLDALEQQVFLGSQYQSIVCNRHAATALKTLISGCRSDIDFRVMETTEALLDYCYQVAGTVGLLICHALDIGAHHAHQHAVALGIGLQLTNIARDVEVDAAMGRCYLPNSLVTAHGSLPAARRALITLAEPYYHYGWQGIRYLPFRWQLATLLASLLYREQGQRLVAHCPQSPNRVHVFSRREQGYATLKAMKLWLRVVICRPSHQPLPYLPYQNNNAL